MASMIPKTIHYCWFGRGELPQLAKECIASWRKFMPDYEIIEWNEDNFDVNMIPYTCAAYAAKKYAYVSDYARFWILYHHGGVYFDTDVEVLKSLAPILEQGPYMGCENLPTIPGKLRVNPGLGMAAESGNKVYADMLDIYGHTKFTLKAATGGFQTIVGYTSDYFYKYGMRDTGEVQEVEGIKIYPAEYFASRTTVEHSIPATENTYTIHHYMASWQPRHLILKKRILNYLPLSFNRSVSRLKQWIKKHM